MRLVLFPVMLALTASAHALPVHRLRCNLQTTYDGNVKRTVRLVVLGPNSWREAEGRQRLTELCATKAKEGYRCSLTPHAFAASAGPDGDEPSTVRIELETGSYVDDGYMDGKPIKTTGTCRPA